MSASVTVIIVNFNAGEHLRRCVAALKAQSYTDFSVVLVDNASSDRSLDLARAEIGDDTRFSISQPQSNLGFAAGNNRGAANTQSRWIATLNPDAFPAADWLETLVGATKRHPDIAMFGSTQVMANDPAKLDGAGDRYFVAGIPWRDRSRARLDNARKQGHDTFETFSPCAAAALYRSNAFRDAGGFDENFFCYVEDVDLAFRMRRRGHRCLQVIDALVHHVGGGAGGGRRSDFARYHGTRNLVWCFAKNMPIGPLILLAPIHLIILGFFLTIAALQGNGGAVARGIRDGIGGLRRIKREKHDAAARSTVLDAVDWTPLGYLRQRFRGE
ncbi:MAG: glycosyltransferase family 2 protein [Alphaproteobacteria bacterium]